MKFEEFRKTVKCLPIIKNDYLKQLNRHNLFFNIQLERWVKKGYVISLRKNFYLLNNEDKKDNPSKMFIAKEIYSPSYISLEYALSIYGLIPERTMDITSVSTKKTNKFENKFGTFIYQHIKENCFTGFVEKKDETGLVYFIATPEKAVADFLYLNKNRFDKNYRDILKESFRFQNTDSLNRRKFKFYVKLFSNQKLSQIAECFLKLDDF
ncbi:MAG: hypothetical protein ABID79_04420 [Elusimicrobiota bacterium]